MVSVSRIDIASSGQFFIIASIDILLLSVALLTGGLGPEIYHKRDVWFAYQCVDGSHIWNPQRCHGIQMNENNTYWTQELAPLDLFNRFMFIEVQPYHLKGDTVNSKLHVMTNFFGRDHPTSDWKTIALRENTTYDLNCLENHLGCDSFINVWEQEINFKYYQVEISFSSPVVEKSWVTDVKFTEWTGNEDYAKFELSFRVIFLFINIIVLTAWIWRLRTVDLFEWSWEQKSTTYILFFLIAFNNPVWPFRLVTEGWFFPLVGSILEVSFTCALLLFWLFGMDQIKNSELRLELSMDSLKRFVPILVAILTYGCLAIALYAWAAIQNESDPVYGTKISGLAILFYFVSLIYIALIVWWGILCAFTIPTLKPHPHMKSRFYFFAIPTGACAGSILIGIFAGTIGPLNQTTMAFFYFLVLFNIYVYTMVWGYWPVDGSISREYQQFKGETGSLLQPEKPLEKKTKPPTVEKPASTPVAPQPTKSVDFHDDL